MATGQIFDIISAKTFYDSIQIEINKYKNSKDKSVANLLYVIMGLNHLREWISEGYVSNSKNPNPKNLKEYFHELIYQEPSFQIIKALCESAKHSYFPINTSVKHNDNMDECENVDLLLNFDEGSVSQYFVNDKDVIEIIDKVFDYYRVNWFENKEKEN